MGNDNKPDPPPTFFGSADSTVGLSLMFLELMILRWLQARFAELLISVGLASRESKVKGFWETIIGREPPTPLAVCINVNRRGLRQKEFATI